MAILRRLRTSVQKIIQRAALSPKESELTRDLVVGISKTGSVQLSKTARDLGGDKQFKREEKRLSEGLAAKASDLDELPRAYVAAIAPVAKTMPFITVDLEDISKPHGKKFENLCTVRDASDKKKPLRPGFWCLTIDACNERHQFLPLVRKIYSTNDPNYKGWWDAIGRGVLLVVQLLGVSAIFLFDRGFDAWIWMTLLNRLHIDWVIRQVQARNILIQGDKVLMRNFSTALKLPHKMRIASIDKNTHREFLRTIHFGFAVVELPRRRGRYTLLVIDHGGPKRIVLLTNKVLHRARDVEIRIGAYWKRWGSEETGRFWKQCTKIEDIRVRGWASIQRLAAMSLIAVGIQALWLIRRPSSVSMLIRRARSFLAWVRFAHYRLWEGVKGTLADEGATCRSGLSRYVAPRAFRWTPISSLCPLHGKEQRCGEEDSSGQESHPRPTWPCGEGGALS